MFPWLLGCYRSYILPRQDGGNPKIYLSPPNLGLRTQATIVTLYCISFRYSLDQFKGFENAQLARLLGGLEVGEPVAGVRGALGVVEHALERLDVADGVAQDLHLGKPLVRHLGGLLPQNLERLVHLWCSIRYTEGISFLLLTVTSLRVLQ